MTDVVEKILERVEHHIDSSRKMMLEEEDVISVNLRWCPICDMSGHELVRVIVGDNRPFYGVEERGSFDFNECGHERFVMKQSFPSVPRVGDGGNDLLSLRKFLRLLHDELEYEDNLFGFDYEFRKMLDRVFED